jgi:predicted enzyme related to lactoylglutathione lyase
MNEVINYLHGMPCWVDTWQHDAAAARDFYEAAFGWRIEAPAPPEDAYLRASLGGLAVAGIGQLPAGSGPPVWSMYVNVSDVEGATEAILQAGGQALIGPRDVAAEGRMAIVTDATGVALGLWEPETLAGAQLVGAPNSWAMSALHTADIAASERFYGTVFGWELVRHSETGLREWRLDGRLIAVASPIGDASVPPHWATNFAVAEVDAFTRRAQSLGANILASPFDTPGFRNALIADPQGAVFAVSATSS